MMMTSKILYKRNPSPKSLLLLKPTITEQERRRPNQVFSLKMTMSEVKVRANNSNFTKFF